MLFRSQQSLCLLLRLESRGRFLPGMDASRVPAGRAPGLGEILRLASGISRSRHEQAYLLAKGHPQKPDAPLPDVQPWEYSGNIAHPTEKAVSILRPLVESFCPAGGVVLDPFAGSGSTLVAAALSAKEGRRLGGPRL